MQPTALPDPPELLNHFSVFIYPFVHDITGPDWQARAAALAPRWAPWWVRLANEELAVALDDSAFFMPYIRGVLFPETTVLQEERAGEGCANWARILRSWTDKGVGELCRYLPPGSVLHLTCRPPLRDALCAFTVVQHRTQAGATLEHEEIPTRLDWLDAMLFPSGLGFLLLKVGLREDLRLSKLMDLNSYLRTVLPPSLYWTLPTLHFPKAARPLRMMDLVNFLTQGLTDRQSGPLTEGVTELLADNWCSAAPYTETEAGRAYGERCQILVYACVHVGESARAGGPGGFPSGEDRLLFEISACLGLGSALNNPMWVPGPDYARLLTGQNRLQAWRCWRAMGLKDTFSFLATEDLDFTRRVLPHNIENDYLPLYLYTLYQKFQLFVFAGDFMRAVAETRPRLRGIRTLMDRFVTFRNRYWFNEITRKALGGDLFRTMQQGLEVSALYQLVSSSVREARDYTQQAYDRRQHMALTLLFLVCGPFAVIFGAVRVFLTGNEPLWLKVLLVSVLGTGVVAAGVYFWFRRSPRRGPRVPPTEGQESLQALTEAIASDAGPP